MCKNVAENHVTRLFYFFVIYHVEHIYALIILQQTGDKETMMQRNPFVVFLFNIFQKFVHNTIH